VERKTLAQLRAQKGLTQRELAPALGITPSALAMYEIGLRTPYLKKAKEIAAYFGVPVEQIIFGPEVKTIKTGTTGD